MTVRIISGDCRDVLKAFEPGTFDCCIADPPYSDTSLAWDRECKGWIEAVARVLKPNGSVWVFGSFRSLVPIFYQMAANGFRYSQDVVWEKQNGTGFHADRFRRVHEHAVMFYRGAWADVYHAPQIVMGGTKKTVRKKRRPAHTGHIDATPYVSVDGGPRLRTSVIYCANEHGRAIHPTQKPVELILPLLRYSCPPGGLALSPFAGSGTDCIAARIAERRMVGIEIDPQMALDASFRIASDAPLFSEIAA
jgi:site-specific DNA-methyltransferase (adenine-specific)